MKGDNTGRFDHAMLISEMSSFMTIVNFFLNIACKQALRGTRVVGLEKEGELTTMSLEFEFHL